MHVERNIDQILGDRLADNVALLVCRIFQQLLAQVVPERVWQHNVRLEEQTSQLRTGHQICEVAESLAENHIAMLRRIFLKLLLEIPAAMLVLTQGGYLALQVFQAGTRKSID